MEKRLYRSNVHKMLGGVCGGLGEYFGIDPTFIRILLVLSVFVKGFGVLAYIVAWIIIPQRPFQMEREEGTNFRFSSWNRYLPGIILVLIGAYFLADHYWWWHNLELFWPLLLIAVGVVMILRYSEHNSHENGQANKQEEANESGTV